jgi:hypothetical protein
MLWQGMHLAVLSVVEGPDVGYRCPALSILANFRVLYSRNSENPFKSKFAEFF